MRPITFVCAIISLLIGWGLIKLLNIPSKGWTEGLMAIGIGGFLTALVAEQITGDKGSGEIPFWTFVPQLIIFVVLKLIYFA